MRPRPNCRTTFLAKCYATSNPHELETQMRKAFMFPCLVVGLTLSLVLTPWSSSHAEAEIDGGVDECFCNGSSAIFAPVSGPCASIGYSHALFTTPWACNPWPNCTPTEESGCKMVVTSVYFTFVDGHTETVASGQQFEASCGGSDTRRYPCPDGLVEGAIRLSCSECSPL